MQRNDTFSLYHDLSFYPPTALRYRSISRNVRKDNWVQFQSPILIPDLGTPDSGPRSWSRSVERIALAHSPTGRRPNYFSYQSDRSTIALFLSSSELPRGVLPGNGKRAIARKLLRVKQNVDEIRRDQPMRRYAVRSTGLLKARSKA